MLLSACGTFNSAKADKRDFAIDTYYPPSNEIQLAEHHARQYWQKNAAGVGTEPRYLAVTASSFWSRNSARNFPLNSIAPR